MFRVLITGASGFIGKHLIRFLSEADGFDVQALPREIDLCDRQATRAAFASAGTIDYILHSADKGGDANWSAKHAATQLIANASMAVNVLEAWRDFQPSARLVGFSTLWAYPACVLDATEAAYWDGRMHQPTEHYGISKKLLGVGIQAMRREHGLKGTMLVLGNVYGPDDTSTRVIPSLMRRIEAAPETLEVFGDPSVTRDFIYIDDQIAGIVRHLDYDGELLNVSSGIHYSIGDLVDILSRIMNFKGDVVYRPSNLISVRNRRLTVDEATAATGWPSNYPLHTLQQGLRKTAESRIRTA